MTMIAKLSNWFWTNKGRPLNMNNCRKTKAKHLLLWDETKLYNEVIHVFAWEPMTLDESHLMQSLFKTAEFTLVKEAIVRLTWQAVSDTQICCTQYSQICWRASSLVIVWQSLHSERARNFLARFRVYALLCLTSRGTQQVFFVSETYFHWDVLLLQPEVY